MRSAQSARKPVAPVVAVAVVALVTGFVIGYLIPRGTRAPAAPAGAPPDAWQPATFKSTLTIATYNVKNFFDAYDNPYTADEGTPAKPAKERRALAEAVRRLDADVLVMQEVEGGGVIKSFANEDLAGMGYTAVVDTVTEDPRGITVVALSRVPVARVTSHRLAPVDQAGATRLSRDLVRLDLRPREGFELTVYGAHLKSKRASDDGADKQSARRRLAEGTFVRGVIREEMPPGARFIVLGDFNDDITSPAVAAVRSATDPPLADALAWVPAGERVTFKNPKFAEAIDQMLLSPRLAGENPGARAEIGSGDAFAVASDHRPVKVTLRIP